VRGRELDTSGPDSCSAPMGSKSLGGPVVGSEQHHITVRTVHLCVQQLISTTVPFPVGYQGVDYPQAIGSVTVTQLGLAG